MKIELSQHIAMTCCIIPGVVQLLNPVLPAFGSASRSWVIKMKKKWSCHLLGSEEWQLQLSAESLSWYWTPRVGHRNCWNKSTTAIHPLYYTYSTNCRVAPITWTSPSLVELIQLPGKVEKSCIYVLSVNVNLPPESSWPIGIVDKWKATDNNRNSNGDDNVPSKWEREKRRGHTGNWGESGWELYK